MYRYLFILLFSFAVHHVVAQAVMGNAVQSVQLADANGRLLPASGAGVQGTPYVFEKFGVGKILFVNGMESIDSNLNYSYFDHKLYFTQKNGLYVVNQQAKEFTLYSEDKENNKVARQFKCLFPNVENNTPATFYEVLSKGVLFQLLKYTHKRIKETAVYGGAPVKEYVSDDLFYIYHTVDKKMLPIGSSLSLKALKKALPNYATQMDALIAQDQINSKKEEGLKLLIQKLQATAN